MTVATENIHGHYEVGNTVVELQKSGTIALVPNKLHNITLCLHHLHPPYNVTIHFRTLMQRYELSAQNVYCYYLLVNTSWYNEYSSLGTYVDVDYRELDSCGRHETMRFKIVGKSMSFVRPCVNNSSYNATQRNERNGAFLVFKLS